MKNKIFLIITCICISCKSNMIINQSESLNILFIGNSLTYTNKMPDILNEFLSEVNLEGKVFHRTAPGFSLINHLKIKIPTKLTTMDSVYNKKRLDSLLSEKWDFVILQEGTVRLLIPEVKKYNVENTIISIKKSSKPNTRFILFGTWVSASEYPKQYCYPKRVIDNKALTKTEYCSSKYQNSLEHIEAIKRAYSDLSTNTKTFYAPNGELYYYFSKKYPNITLLEDNIHPNLAGAFLNACVFYQTITNRQVDKIKYNGGLSADTATKIKKFVTNYLNDKELVFSSYK